MALIKRGGVHDPRLMRAVRAVDRGDFVPEHDRSAAYRDRPVGIPEAQTTSQPSLIVRMIEVATVGPNDRVLEVGTGYGYQSALLAHLTSEVVSVERWESLAKAARANLRRAGLTNVDVLVGDGWKGCPERAPFHAIIVSAAASKIPKALVDQLVEGGRLVIPLAERSADNVYVFTKTGPGLDRGRLVTPARFVPLVGGDA